MGIRLGDRENRAAVHWGTGYVIYFQFKGDLDCVVVLAYLGLVIDCVRMWWGQSLYLILWVSAPKQLNFKWVRERGMVANRSGIEYQSTNFIASHKYLFHPICYRASDHKEIPPKIIIRGNGSHPCLFPIVCSQSVDHFDMESSTLWILKI